MPCFHPIKAFPSPSGGRVSFSRPAGHSGRTLDIACGQCIGCRLGYAAMWAARLVAESYFHDVSLFLTLTQDEDHASDWSSVDKRVLQLFWKRCRKAGYKFRYLAVGEYGERAHRAHYHAAVFGLSLPDLVFFRNNERGERLYTSAVLSELWGRGFVSIGLLDYTSAAYVAGYCLRDKRAKQAGSADVVSEATGEIVERALPFSVMSRRPGLGRDYVVKYGSQFAAEDNMVINGKRVPTPKYFHDVLSELNPSLAADLKAAREREVYSDRAKRERRPARLAVREACKVAGMSIARRGTRRGTL